MTTLPGGRTISIGSCYEPVLKGYHVASPGRGSGLPQNTIASEPAATPMAHCLKHVDTHIQQTIILHNIVMNIEIEVTYFIMLGRTYYIMVHVHAYIQYNFYYDPYCPKSDGILRLVL
jgi:hypothetical protein